MNSKSISFMLPGSGANPSGGIKVILEQANRLANKGYEVHLVYPIYNLVRKPTIRNIAGVLKRYIGLFVFNDYKSDNWFNVDPRILQHKVISLQMKHMPLTNYYCATSLETSYYLNDYKIANDRKIYYIQGFETWNLPEPYTLKSYKFLMKKIVITPYLQKKVEEQGGNATLIYNGFDFTEFGIDIPLEKRNPHIGIMMYSPANDIKRCSDVFHAFQIVKKKIPDLKVIVFGYPHRPSNLPDWYEYHQSPDRQELRKLYNSASVFVAASKTEGMALPPAEALICGCSITCTNIPGFSIYAIQDRTALLCQVYDVDALANNIICLMENDEIRLKLAHNGNELIQKFTWERASDLFEKTLLSNIKSY